MAENFIIETKINNEEYSFRLMTLNEFKQTINAKSNGTLGSYLTKLLNACYIKPNIDFNNIPKALGELLILHLWVYSVSGVENGIIELDKECLSCGKNRHGKVNLENSYIYSDVDSPQERQKWDLAYKLTNYTELLLHEPKLFQDSDKIDMITNSIAGVRVLEESGSITTLYRDEFTQDDMNSLLQLLTLDKLEEIIKTLETKKCVSLYEFDGPCSCGDDSSIVPIVGLKEIMQGIQ